MRAPKVKILNTVSVSEGLKQAIYNFLKSKLSKEEGWGGLGSSKNDKYKREGKGRRCWLGGRM